MRRLFPLLCLPLALSLVAGCGGEDASAPAAAPSRTSSSPGAASSPRVSAAVTSAYDAMSPAERIGQLFVFGVMSTGATDEQLGQLREGHAGNAFLRGPTDLGVDGTREVTDEIAGVTTVAGVKPFVSADQESGNASTLKGPGFSRLPTGLEQGELRPARLRREARSWGEELKAAGVTLDLAPVADVVPSDVGTDNAPIGYFERQLGSDPEQVGNHVAAVVRGMSDAGVATSLKHFPGIGRATGNTDSDPEVTDPTTADDPLLESFRRGIAADPPMVMVSSAFYPAISARPRACFNPAIMKDLLREKLGYDGVIISDSFGSASVAGDPPGKRALRFFRAGGTLLLDTNSDDLAPMARAVLEATRRDTDFAATTKTDVLRVLEAKERFGLLPS